jgi:CO/xanthine dehydrogenase Mo-binding subunit
MVFEDGKLLNGSLADYKIPGFLDVPRTIGATLIEDPHPTAPFGAVGVGESGSYGVTPAIANALCDATGVRIREMPLTPERVLRALRAAAGTPLGDD